MPAAVAVVAAIAATVWCLIGGRAPGGPVVPVSIDTLRLARLNVPAGLRGRDLSPAILGARGLTPQGIYAEALYPRYHFGWSELTSLTDERFRFIRAPREEQYDLERDQRDNLIATRPQAAAGLRAALDALTAGREIDKPSAVSDEDRQRLAALGYVGTDIAPPAMPGEETSEVRDRLRALGYTGGSPAPPKARSPRTSSPFLLLVNSVRLRALRPLCALTAALTTAASGTRTSRPHRPRP